MSSIKLKNQYRKHKNSLLGLSLFFFMLGILWKYHSDYEPILFPVLADLLLAYVVYIAYSFSKDLSSKSTSSVPIIVGKALMICATISIVIWSTYGTHTEESDPLFGGGGYTVQEFEPTKQERNQSGWKAFFIIALPSLIGIHKGLEERNLNRLLKK